MGTRTPIRRVTEEPARKANPFVLPVEIPGQPSIRDPKRASDPVPVVPVTPERVPMKVLW